MYIFLPQWKPISPVHNLETPLTWMLKLLAGTVITANSYLSSPSLATLHARLRSQFPETRNRNPRWGDRVFGQRGQQRQPARPGLCCLRGHGGGGGLGHRQLSVWNPAHVARREFVSGWKERRRRQTVGPSAGQFQWQRWGMCHLGIKAQVEMKSWKWQKEAWK